MDKLDLILQKLEQMDGRLERVDGRLERVDERLERVDERLERVDERLDRQDERLERMDERMEQQDERLDGMELLLGHLGPLQQDIGGLKVLLEHDLPKQIQLLAEGHSAVLERLPEAEEIDSLRGRVRILEAVVRKHSAQLAEIKRAE